MLRDFNLLATTSRGNEDKERSELRYLLEEVGDSAATVEKTGVLGLVAARTVLDPFEVIKKFRAILRVRSYEFRYTLRVIPIEAVVPTDLAEIQKITARLCSKIGQNESFRVTVEKRFTGIHSREIIEAAAEKIERKVDLTNPSKILLIEIIGGLTGISVIVPSDILSVVKERML